MSNGDRTVVVDGWTVRRFVLRESGGLVVLSSLGWLASRAAFDARMAMDRVPPDRVTRPYVIAALLAVVFAIAALAWQSALGVPRQVRFVVLGIQGLIAGAVVLVAPFAAAGSSSAWTNLAFVAGGWWLAAVWLGVTVYRLMQQP